TLLPRALLAQQRDAQRVGANRASQPASPYPQNTMNVERAMENAARTISELNKDKRGPLREGLEDNAFMAAFRSRTSVGTLLRTPTAVGLFVPGQYLAEVMSPTLDSPAVTAYEVYDMGVKDGLGHYTGKIVPYADTKAMYDAMAGDAKREQKDWSPAIIGLLA